ncbi:MAG: cytochrome P450 [Alphaproteobacteria bacterium]|nr:cytochrome P450 [Alphaproteobacteria bacterium]
MASPVRLSDTTQADTTQEPGAPENGAGPPGTLFTPPVPEPPPAALPWWGLVGAFRTNVIGGWPAPAYEEMITQRRFLGRTSLLLNSPAAIRQVLVDDNALFQRTRATMRILRPILGDGLFISDGDAWRHQRRTLAPAFTPKASTLLTPHILAAARETVAALDAAKDQPVNLLATVQHLTLEIAGRTMFSLEMRRHGPTLRDLVAHYSKRLGRPHLLDFLLPLKYPSPQDFGRRRFGKVWMALIEQIVAERHRVDDDAAPRDLFDLLMQARDPETGATFTPLQLRDQVATMITAGHETTGVALFWALYLLAMAPEIQERVAAEADGVALEGDAAESPGDNPLSRLPYTRAVIDEAMRLYPPAFAIVRAARSDATVQGIPVERGSLLILAPWILHRHKRLWQNPGAFDPSRFLPGAPPVDRFAYLPFGIGPRVCIGAHFALTEATLVLASLVKAFRIEKLGTRPVMPLAVVTTQPDHAPEFRLQRR